MGKGGMNSLRQGGFRRRKKNFKNKKYYYNLYPEVLFEMKDRIMKELNGS